MGQNPNFIWRSIWETQVLLQKGLRWRVGIGESISVLKDPWLPVQVNPYVSTISINLETYNVNNLFCVDSRKWDEYLVKDMFDDRWATIILNMSLSNILYLDDSWYWGKEVNGVYTIKNTYKWLQSLKIVNKADDNLGFWKDIK